MDQTDNMTETRGSLDHHSSLWTSFRAFLCPCLAAPHDQTTPSTRNDHSNFKPTEKTESNSIKGFNLAAKGATAKIGGHRKASDDAADHDSKREGLLEKKGRRSRGERETIELELGAAVGEPQPQPASYSVCQFPEDQLLSIGINESHLLVRIHRTELHPNAACARKDLTQSPKRKKDRQDPELQSPEFEKFWTQRYLIFEKFDEGVKLDKGSWSTTPPWQVSEVVAGKCCGAKVILDAFAGVGGNAIKLANVSSCLKLIANDWSAARLRCLLNNAKVYEAECNIEISEQDFLTVDAKSVDVVFAQPPFRAESSASSLSIVDFEPTLNKVIMKCLRLAGDMVLLLPPQTGLEGLCSCLNKCASELRKMRGSCSVTIDKLYFQGELKYLLLSLGGLVQRETRLNDELDFIYSRLKRKTDPAFRHKKVVKRIREDHGMLELLNLLKLSEKRAQEKASSSGVLGRSEDVMEAFFDLIRERDLISAEKLEKLQEEQTPDTKKRPSLITSSVTTSLERSKEEREGEGGLEAVMEEEKVEENEPPYRQSEQTQSDYSHYSYLSGMVDRGQAQGSRLVRLQSDSFSSVIIKRTLNGSREKRDISPNGSPNSPRRIGKNRISQVAERKEVAESKKRAREL